ncbi:MAG TPA: STAS domain-containing protein [Planctomycetaceae bacterium]|nr:STAS domain-containing protein [Planctomycetaceae bacterium]
MKWYWPRKDRLMGRLEQTQFHKVFPAEVDARTLVVTPRGDSVSFRDSDVANELNTLLSLIGTPGIVNLVIDLSNAEYFGSTMIGAINQLGTRFREIGGKIALCSLSPQMSEMLDIMHLSDRWMKFDTRKIALRFMSKS